MSMSGRVWVHNAVVVALARGGVPVGVVVANTLHLPFRVLVVRKIGVPWQPELAMGAMAGSVQFLDDQIVRALGVPAEDLKQVIAREHAELKRRESLYGTQSDRPDLQAQTVILVDDGLATGNTMLAAVRHIRSLNPARIVIAVPVGSRQARDQLRGAADNLICVATPYSFGAIGEWYRQFGQVSDDEVVRLLEQSHRGAAALSAQPAGQSANSRDFSSRHPAD